TQLVEEGLLEDALKLDQAYITTIHGFGLRLLTEYAFEAGVSPSPRLLNEDEEKTLIRLALSETKETDGVLDDLQKFGYRYDFNSGKGPEDLFRDKILFLLSKFRSLGKLAKDDRILAHALQKLTATYGPTGDPALLKLALLVAVQDLLRRFPADLAPLFDKKTVVETFRGDYRALKRAEKGDTLDTDWRLWQQLRGLRQSKGGSPTPDGYDDLAGNVIAAAEGLLQHPGPRQEAEVLLSSLLLGSQDCLLRYGESKREKGLVDYTDMLAVAFQLLSRNQEALTDLKNRVDCLVIDEFQDTNPLQFSLMWALQRAGVPTLIVGDLKQAIMRFQNADSRLMAQLQKDFQEYLDPLENNWRSSPALMAWVNQIGAGLFGADYTHLTPKAAFETQLSPLEIIDIPKRAKKDGNYIIAQQTVARIRDLLEAGDQLVYDRHTKEMRPLRGSDIAILCPINAHLDHYARALRAIGIQPQLEEDGWFESRIVQLLYYCLSYVADNEDRHAALYLAVTELGHYDLKAAVSTLVDGVPLQEPVLESLKEVSLQCADLAVDAILQEIIVKLDLFNIIVSWPDSTQARANVLRLLGETSAFIGANREALASGGYYGSGLKTFLAWLKSRAEQENSQPAPRVVDENGVQLMTWHKSKGKEWPVVAVCGSYRDIKARLPSFDVVYEDFSDLGTILEKAAIEITPDFVAPETKENFLAPLQEAAIDDALRLLYVVLTRSRDKLILEWPSFLKPEKVTYWNLLTERAQITIDKNKMRVGAVAFDCRISQGDSEALPEFAETGADDNTTLPTVGRRAIVKGALPTDLTPEAITPSSRHGAEEAKVGIQTIQY
ncbi:MAG: UvrD-helicase domain-containing protein, partial [Desulfurivibrionaceae bacterium]|nr:UvrD-helicase domain-containing protein [Desulfurivibrionaceae bacterium]